MLSKIGQQFKRPSGFWGNIVASLMAKGNSNAYKILINDLQIQPGNKILEIGYGPGAGINAIAKQYASCEIHGIDFSELMYKKATKRNKTFAATGRVNLMFGDFIDAQIPANNFDKIFCLNVVYFWDNLQQPFEKINSLLGSNGAFYFFMASKTDLNRFKFTKNHIFNKYEVEQVVEALKLAGFGEVAYYYKNGYFVKAKK